MIRLMNSNQTGPINIGNPNKFTIRELADAIRGQIDPDLMLLQSPLSQDDPLQRKPVIKLANEHLDWYPKIELEQGLQRTIAWFRERLENEAS